MKKVKLILGTVNSCSLAVGEKTMAELYERAYKPFLRIAHACKLPVTMYYSGELMSWVIDRHDGIQMLINDIVKRRKIEFLGGGYYSPLFSLIPRKDRVDQIEIMTTDIRKRFGRRPRGMWITEKVWEPSMPMTMNNAGMEFSFLDEEFFEDAGLFNGELYRPCITEDQGKKVIIFPLSNRLISHFLISDPEEVVEKIIACGSEKEERYISFLIPGEELDFNDGAAERLEKFFNLIEANKKHIEVVLPGKIVRELHGMKKVYFGCVSPGDIGRWSGPIYRDQPNNADADKESGIRKNINYQSFFRHFLAKYPESNNLYSRMIEVHKLVSQMRGDRQRKKSAGYELYKSQNHSAFWHGGGYEGIYSFEERRRAYAALIEAEKFTREKTGFRSSFLKDDFDMDGFDEYLYRGQSMNVNIHQKGGVIFELDYFRTPHNYLATMARHKEWYHENEVTDKYTRNTFIDHFFKSDETAERFLNSECKEAGDFIAGEYKTDRYDKVQKKLCLERSGSIITKKNKFPVTVKKTYTIKRNIIILDYEIINNSESVLNTIFATEINLAIDQHGRKKIDLISENRKKSIKANTAVFTEEHVSVLHTIDRKRKVNLIFDFSKECSLWGGAIHTKTGTGKVVESLYQCDCFLPLWTVSVAPGKSWQSSLQLKVDRRTGRD